MLRFWDIYRFHEGARFGDEGFRVSDGWEEAESQIRDEYSQIFTSKNKYFESASFMERLHGYAVKHNFIQAYAPNSSDEAFLDIPPSMFRKEKEKNKMFAWENKTIGVPVGVIASDPAPQRLVVARFIQFKVSFAHQHFCIS